MLTQATAVKTWTYPWPLVFHFNNKALWASLHVKEGIETAGNTLLVLQKP